MEQTIVQKLPGIGEVLSVSVKAMRANFGVYMKVILPYFAVTAELDLVDPIPAFPCEIRLRVSTYSPSMCPSISG